MMTLFSRALIVMVLITGTSATLAMADEAANEALARRFYTEVNAGNIAAFDQFIAADMVDHSAMPGAPAGLPAMKHEMEQFTAAFPDMKIQNEIVIPKGDYVTVISTAAGTNTGAMMGMPATGKPVNFGAIDVWKVKDGKLAEVWHVEQLLQMMMQIGAVPMPK